MSVRRIMIMGVYYRYARAEDVKFDYIRIDKEENELSGRRIGTF